MQTSHIINEDAYDAAVKRNILANARKTFLATVPRAGEIVFAVGAGYSDNGKYAEGFMGSMAYSLDTYGKLTPAQCAAVLKGIDARAARKTEWADQKAALNASRVHLGTVGAKLTVTITIAHMVVLEGIYGTSFLYICEDADQNVVIYKGTSATFGFTADGAVRVKGDSLTVTATVKEHGVRDGVKQTVIQRPKVIA
jgi:hypothetical protein